MKQFKLKYLLVTLSFVSILAACSKNDPAPGPDGGSSNQTAGVYILNQGNFNQNNSTLSYYDYSAKTLTADRYLTANSTKLGDTGNDLGIYGTKMYIVVNNSNLVNITRASTAKLTKQLTISQPRYLAFYRNYAFVSSYNGTVSVIDTTSLTITKTITVGRSPEQMTVANGKLYVANSGGLDYPDLDKTLSVIDLTTLTEIKKITVTTNPITITSDRYNNVYVLSVGNYGGDATHPAVSAGLTVVNALTDEVRSQTNVNLGYNIPIMAQGDFVYYPTADNKIAMYNARTQSLERANFIVDGTVITSPYAFAFDTTTGQLFIADAKDYSSDGTLYAFSATGQKLSSIITGINPGRIALLNK